MPPMWRLDKRAKIEWTYRNKVAKLKLAEAIFSREYHRIVGALGGLAHQLADQYEMQRLGHPYYNSRAGGGEGHLEVAKNIYYSNKEPGAHGAQREALRLHAVHAVRRRPGRGRLQPQGHHLPARSRLPARARSTPTAACRWRWEAKIKAKGEFAEALEATGLTLDQCYEYVNANPELKRPMYIVPHRKGVVSTAANFVHHRRPHEEGRLPACRSGTCSRLAVNYQSLEISAQGRVDQRGPENDMSKHFLVGMDVGSTTVKAVVVDAATDEVVWQDYQRHDTKQPEKIARVPQAV